GKSQRPRTRRGNAEQERTARRRARDARAVNGRPGRCRWGSDGRQVFSRGDGGGGGLALRFERTHSRPRPLDLLVVAGVAGPAGGDEQREEAGGFEMGGQDVRRIARTHETARRDAGVVGPHFEDDRAYVAVDLIVDADRGREAGGVTLEIDDELADGASADA